MSRRFSLVREIAAGPLVKAVAALIAVLGTVTTIRELAFSEKRQQQFNFYRLWASWPWYFWVIVVLLFVVAVVFEGAFAAVQKREKLLESAKRDHEALQLQIRELHDERIEQVGPIIAHIDEQLRPIQVRAT